MSNINRKAVVERFSPENTGIDRYSPFSVGNGEFAFTCDITGMQTFYEKYDFIPLCTMANWGWHNHPYKEDQPEFDHWKAVRTLYSNSKRLVPYLTHPDSQEYEYEWLRRNPHKFNLGRIMFMLHGEPLEESRLTQIRQKLELYKGEIESTFRYDGIPVSVRTFVDPKTDTLSFEVDSPLLKEGLQIGLKFPAPDEEKWAADWKKESAHVSCIFRNDKHRTDIMRQMDNDRYFVSILSDNGKVNKLSDHLFTVRSECEKIKLSFVFSKVLAKEDMRAFDLMNKDCVEYWRDYWESGGFIDIRGGGDEGRELERRIILSQYLTAIQCAGSLPPAETGLTFNSWHGKFHLEMHWWHCAHFALWQKPQLLARSMWYYKAIMPVCSRLAGMQGYDGVRWTKMTDPSGLDSPSEIGPLLIWQQPHPIYYAELIYRAQPEKSVLENYFDIVQESAKFMASYMTLNEKTGRYDLGPALIPAQENHSPDIAVNPTFELEYWRFGLATANLWRERMGLERIKEWDEKASLLADAPIKDGVYLAHEHCPDTFEKFNRDHPSMLMAKGMLPGKIIDDEIMGSTLKAVMYEGKWQIDTQTWGWDFPVIAMTAARLNMPEDAVKGLLYPAAKNVYLNCGHNRQADKDQLPIYLPGNGGILAAAALMCAGWDGCKTDKPGFPESWDVHFENILPFPNN